MSLFGVIRSKLGIPMNIDMIHEGAVTVSERHSQTHKGNMYTCRMYDGDVDTGTPKYWMLRTPNTSNTIHLIGSVSSKKHGLLEMFENPTLTADGTACIPVNKNRNSVNLTTAQVFEDPSVTVDGNRLLVNTIGSDGTGSQGGTGGLRKLEEEFVLKQNEEYLFKYSASVNDTEVVLNLEFYETII